MAFIASTPSGSCERPEMRAGGALSRSSGVLFGVWKGAIRRYKELWGSTFPINVNPGLINHGLLISGVFPQ